MSEALIIDACRTLAADLAALAADIRSSAFRRGAWTTPRRSSTNCRQTGATPNRLPPAAPRYGRASPPSAATMHARCSTSKRPWPRRRPVPETRRQPTADTTAAVLFALIGHPHVYHAAGGAVDVVRGTAELIIDQSADGVRVRLEPNWHDQRYHARMVDPRRCEVMLLTHTHDQLRKIIPRPRRRARAAAA